MLNYEAACAFGTAGVTCWGRSDLGSLEVPLLIIDPDGDGYTNQGGLDLFPENREHQDIDRDGVGDNGDAFPEDGTEWADSDADGVGDNADAFPDDASEVADAMAMDMEITLTLSMTTPQRYLTMTLTE